MKTKVFREIGALVRRRLTSLPALTGIISVLVIIYAVAASGISVRNHAISHGKESLHSLTMRQSASLSAMLNDQFDTLNNYALDFSEHLRISRWDILVHLKTMVRDQYFNHVSYADLSGNCYMESGAEADVSRRSYFLRALEGKRSVQRIVDPQGGSATVFVLAAPVIRNGEIIGVVLASCPEQTLEERVSSFINTPQAFTLIASENGDLLVSSSNPDCDLRERNVFASLLSAWIGDGLTVDQLKKRIDARESDTFYYRTASGRRYAAFAPLDVDSSTKENWFMLTSISESEVNGPANGALWYNSCVILMAVIACASAFWFIIKYQKRECARLTDEYGELKALTAQNRAALAAAGIEFARYDLKTEVFYNKSERLKKLGYGDEIANAPQAFIDNGLVTAECIDQFRAFYEKLRCGEGGLLTTAFKSPNGGYFWFRMKATIVYDEGNQPSWAIILFRDVSEAREREVLYAKWRQSINMLDPGSYTLFRCNLSKGPMFDMMEGKLLDIHFKPSVDNFNARTLEYASKFVYAEDFDEYVKMLNKQHLLDSYYRGSRTETLDYREIVSDGEYRWIRLRIDMVKYPDCDDIEGFLMYKYPCG